MRHEEGRVPMLHIRIRLCPEEPQLRRVPSFRALPIPRLGQHRRAMPLNHSRRGLYEFSHVSDETDAGKSVGPLLGCGRRAGPGCICR